MVKIIGATLAARLSGIVWRESLTIGSLMSCKGLVELIVLNIGLQARILSTRTFTIFVVMALVTTFVTTPLVSFLYPPAYQKKLAAWKRGELTSWDSDAPSDGTGAIAQQDLPANNRVGQLLVYLRLDNMPSVLNLVALFGKESNREVGAASDEKGAAVLAAGAETAPPPRAVRAHGLRLVQLGDRDSSVMTVSEVDEYASSDPVVNTWRTVGQILKVAVSGEVATMPEHRFSEALLAKSTDISSDLILLPWSGDGNLGDTQNVPDNRIASSYISFTMSLLSSGSHNLAILFPAGSHPKGVSREPASLKLQRTRSFTDIHREIQPLPVKNKACRVVLPFFGGADDKLALMLVLQLCERQEVTATIFHLMPDGAAASEDREYLLKISNALPAHVAARVEFKSCPSNDVAEELVGSATSSLREDSGDVAWTNLVVLGRRSSKGKLAHGIKTQVYASDELVECLGDAAGALIGVELKADLLVVQARSSRT